MVNERVGNAQRMKVLDLLSKALEEGYLELSEYEARSNAVTAAKTVEDLSRQLADLPAPFRWDPRQHHVVAQATAVEAGPVDRNTAQTMASLSVVLGAVSLPTSLCFLGVALGVAAIVLGRVAMRTPDAHRQGLTGLVLGCVGAVMSAVFIVIALISEVPETA